MSEYPRPDDAPQGTLPTHQAPGQATSAQGANAAKRRFLIKALQVGSAVPVIMTISRPAFAQGTSATAGSPLHS